MGILTLEVWMRPINEETAEELNEFLRAQEHLQVEMPPRGEWCQIRFTNEGLKVLSDSQKAKQLLRLEEQLKGLGWHADFHMSSFNPHHKMYVPWPHISVMAAPDITDKEPNYNPF